MKTAREAAKLSIEQVAEAVAVTPRTVLNWEHDLGSPRLDHAGAICKALGISPSLLIFGRERA